MAQRGKPLSAADQARIKRLVSGGVSIKGAAKELQVSRNTVRRYTRKQV